MRSLWVEEHALPAPPLPRDVADVLHILEPTPDHDTTKWLGWLVLAGLLVLFILWLRGRSAKVIEKEPSPRPISTATPPSSGLAGQIDSLRAQILNSGEYRQGCHRLAALLRQRGEDVESRPMTVWTSGEIAEFLGDAPLSRVMMLLAELQFGRQVPGRSDFEGVCELASDASAERRW